MSDAETEIAEYLRRRAADIEPRFDLDGVKAGRESIHPAAESREESHGRRFAVLAAAVVVIVAGVVGFLVMSTHEGVTTVVAPADPNSSSTTSTPVAASPPIPVGPPLVVDRGDVSESVLPLAMDVPDMAWEQLVVSNVESLRRTSVVVAATDGLIVAGTAEGRAVGLDPETAAIIWAADLTAGTVALPDYNSYAMYPAIDGDVVYIAASTGVVYALEAATGEEIWSAPVGGLFGGFPVVVDGAVVVGRSWWDIYDDMVDYAGPVPATAGGVVALDAATGDVLWEQEFDQQAFVSAGPEGHVLIGSFDSQFIGNGAIELADAATGETLWRIDGVDIDSPPAFGNGVVLIAARDLIAIDYDGREIWRTSDDWCSCTFQFPAVVDNTAGIVTNEGAIYGLDLRSGETCWGFRIGENYGISYTTPRGLSAFATGVGVFWIDAATGGAAAFPTTENQPLSLVSIANGEVLATGDGYVRLLNLTVSDSEPVPGEPCN